MATTSPDNLRTPNPTDPYNLIADWAISMSDVQAALTRRANLYVGTSSQRTAFTTAAEGVHWQDTNGDRKEFVRQAGAWVDTRPDTGWVAPSLPSGYTGLQGFGYRVLNGVLYLRGRISRGSGNVETGVTLFTLPPSARPSEYTRAAISSFSGTSAPAPYVAINETNGAVTIGVMGSGGSGDIYFGGVAIPVL